MPIAASAMSAMSGTRERAIPRKWLAFIADPLPFVGPNSAENLAQRARRGRVKREAFDIIRGQWIRHCG
jgi:hypothetical protein